MHTCPVVADDDSDDEEEGDSLTQDVLQHAYLQQQQQQQQQQPPSDLLHGLGSMGSMPFDPAARSTSSRGGGSSSWLRGRTGSASGLGEGGGLEEGSSVFSLGDLGADAVSTVRWDQHRFSKASVGMKQWLNSQQQLIPHHPTPPDVCRRRGCPWV